jgi:hypothetical protein
MACNHNNINCGCKDSYLTTPPPCPTPADCPERQPCSEVFPAECIIYTGPDLECNENIVIAQNTAVAQALEDLVGYICNVEDSIPVTVVEAGDGIEVTSTTVGTTTTYTVSTEAPVLRKFVKEFTSVFDGDVLDIFYTELQACGLITDSCGVDGTEFSDFTYSIFYLSDQAVWTSLSQENNIVLTVDNITGNIKVTLDTAPVEPPVRVRVTVIG